MCYLYLVYLDILQVITTCQTTDILKTILEVNYYLFLHIFLERQFAAQSIAFIHLESLNYLSLMSFSLYICIYIHVCIHTHIHIVCVYIYVCVYTHMSQKAFWAKWYKATNLNWAGQSIHNSQQLWRLCCHLPIYLCHWNSNTVMLVGKGQDKLSTDLYHLC